MNIAVPGGTGTLGRPVVEELVRRGHDVGREDRQVSVAAFTVDDGRITTIHVQRNPDKLRHLDAPGV